MRPSALFESRAFCLVLSTLVVSVGFVRVGSVEQGISLCFYCYTMARVAGPTRRQCTRSHGEYCHICYAIILICQLH